jgi:hypothetical protein
MHDAGSVEKSPDKKPFFRSHHEELLFWKRGGKNANRTSTTFCVRAQLSPSESLKRSQRYIYKTLIASTGAHLQPQSPSFSPLQGRINFTFHIDAIMFREHEAIETPVQIAFSRQIVGWESAERIDTA